MADTKQEFVALFRAYMKDGDAKKLFAFVDGQPLDRLRECLAAYFDADTGHEQRPRARAVFVRLVVTAVGKDFGFALFAQAMKSAARTPWPAHYKELSGGEKSSVDKAIDKQKARLPAIPRAFADKFDSYMTKGKGGVTLDKISGFLKVLKPADAQACLALYVEMSPWYEKGNDEASLNVFFLASSYALQPGEVAYARAYTASIEAELNVWHTRFSSLRPDQQKYLRDRIKDAITTDPPAEAGKRKAPLSEDEQHFIRLYRKYVDTRDRRSMDTFQRLLAARGADALAGYVQLYLDDSAAHYGEPASHESLQIFFGTLSMAIAKGSAWYAYKVRAFIDSPDTIWHKRYAALDPRQYGNPLRSQLEAAIKSKARFIDDLRIAYYLKTKRDAGLVALRNFEPVAVPKALLEQLSGALADVEVGVGARNPEFSEKAFSAVSAILVAQKDLPTLWVLAKRCRERTALLAQYRHLVYFMAVGLLYMAAAVKYPVSHKNGFNDDEQALFFDGAERGDRYFDDFAAQMTAAIWRRAGRPPKVRGPRNETEAAGPDDMYTAMAKTEGLLQVHSDRMGLTLTPLVEAAALRGAVDEAWSKHSQEVGAMRIPIDSRTSVKVGETIGNVYVLWWDEQHRTVYLQVNGFEQVVFETDQPRLAKIYMDHSFYGVVAENTQHLLELIPFIFEILGYLPDLVSGGLLGLAKSIIFNLAFDKSMRALGIDPMKAQLFMLGASLLIHGVKPKEAAGSGAHMEVETLEVHEVHGEVHELHGEAHGQAKEAHSTEFQGTGESNTHAATGSKPGSGASVVANDNKAIVTEPKAYSDVTRRQVSKVQEQVQEQANRFAQEAGEAAEQQVALAAGAEHQGGAATGDAMILETATANDNTMVASRGRGSGGAKPRAARTKPVSHPAVYVPRKGGPGFRVGDGSSDLQQVLNTTFRRGHHVYLYHDRRGRLLYAGKSGGEEGHSDWFQRAVKSHRETGWIEDAHSVTVYYDLSEQEMWALEEAMIGRDPTGASGNYYALYNRAPGEYTKRFGELGLGANASSAMKRPSVRFAFMADPLLR